MMFAKDPESKNHRGHTPLQLARPLTVATRPGKFQALFGSHGFAWELDSLEMVEVNFLSIGQIWIGTC